MNVKKILKQNPYFRKIKKFQIDQSGTLNNNSDSLNFDESGSTQIDSLVNGKKDTSYEIDIDADDFDLEDDNSVSDGSSDDSATFMILSKPLKKQQSSTDNQQDGSLDFSQN